MNKWLYRNMVGVTNPQLPFPGNYTGDNTVKNIVFPETKLGIPIGVLFGTKLIDQPPVVWWGDLRIVKHPVTDSGGKK